MSRRQRFTFLAIAVVIAVVAIVVLADSSEDDTTPNPTSATSTPEGSTGEETPTPTATPTPEPPPLLTGDEVTKLEFTEGETVKFRVRSDEPEEVHVHGYDISKDIEAGQTATMSFRATITGIFDIEFEHSGTQIAELKVEPK